LFLEIDKHLIRRLKNNDRKAQLELYNQCFNILMSISYRYKNNEEDAIAIANSSFLKILTNIEFYKTSTPFEAWIRRITINTAIDEYRKEKRNKETIEYQDYYDNHSEFSLNEYDLKISAEEINEMIIQLPKATNHVFNLFAIDGYSHKEIAKMLNISANTSKWHVKQARKKLKELIKNKRKKLEVKK